MTTSDHSALIDLPDGKRGLAESVRSLLTTERAGRKGAVICPCAITGRSSNPLRRVVSYLRKGRARGIQPALTRDGPPGGQP